MSKTVRYRAYVNHAHRCVMVWHRSLKCWNVAYINKSGDFHGGRRILSSFEAEKSKAIAELRAAKDSYGDPALPQTGWKKVLIPVQGATDWANLSLIIWNKLQAP